jgi:DNA-binding NarL/FixJ family response regulator
MPELTVLLVDDHDLVRRGFRRILEDEDDIRVVAEASDAPAAVDQALKLRPSVVVMDFALPSMNGAVATRQILRSNPEAGVLILSMHSESSYVRTCLDAGARGYLLKSAMDLELLEGVRRVAAGCRVLDKRLGGGVELEGNRPNLTTRELEIVQLIVNGKSNRDIALVLGLSINTVAVHRANIMQVLDVHNTAEMVVFAIRQGLVSIT